MTSLNLLCKPANLKQDADLSLGSFERSQLVVQAIMIRQELETNSIQIQNGVLGADCKNMTVLLTLSTLVTCRKYVKTHTESA